MLLTPSPIHASFLSLFDIIEAVMDLETLDEWMKDQEIMTTILQRVSYVVRTYYPQYYYSDRYNRKYFENQKQREKIHTRLREEYGFEAKKKYSSRSTQEFLSEVAAQYWITRKIQWLKVLNGELNWDIPSSKKDFINENRWRTLSSEIGPYRDAIDAVAKGYTWFKKHKLNEKDLEMINRDGAIRTNKKVGQKGYFFPREEIFNQQENDNSDEPLPITPSDRIIENIFPEDSHERLVARRAVELRDKYFMRYLKSDKPKSVCKETNRFKVSTRTGKFTNKQIADMVGTTETKVKNCFSSFKKWFKKEVLEADRHEIEEFLND